MFFHRTAGTFARTNKDGSLPRPCALATLFAILIAWSLLLVSPAPVLADNAPGLKPILFSTPVAPDSVSYKYYSMIYTEAFKRLGYAFRMISYPVKRSLVAANAGQTDGDTGRIVEVKHGEHYNHIILVPESIGTSEAAIYSNNGTESFQGWDDLDRLRGSEAIIAYSRGYRVAEIHLLNHVDEENILTTSDALQSCRMLGAHRLDYVIEPRGLLESFMASGQCAGEDIHLAGVLHRSDVFPVLNIRYKDLAPELAGVLKEMKAEGLLEEYRIQANE